jgi:Xaa-Pro aminopeptidase
MKKFSLFLCAILLLAGCMEKNEKKSISLIPDPDNAVISGMFAKRRAMVLDSLKDGILVLRASVTPGTARFGFRQDNYFYYLTGYPESPSWLILAPGNSNPFMLFVTAETPHIRMWDGTRVGIDRAMNVYGADTACPIASFSGLLNHLLEKQKTLYINAGDEEVMRSLVLDNRKNIEIKDIRPVMDEMRVIKDDEEIRRLTNATAITCDAYRQACRVARPGLNEADIEAVIEYTYRIHHSEMPGFRSIVASGEHSTVLHYSQNCDILDAGELLLTDIGAEYHNYTADLTRTIPVSGTFTPEQKEIYELVLNSQNAAIEKMLPGHGILEAHHASTNIIVRGLYKMGLITDTTRNWQKAFYVLYPISHYIGLEVHDAGSLGLDMLNWQSYMFDESVKGRIMQPGMVFTAEPGLYLRREGLELLKEIFKGQVPEEEMDAFVTTVKPVYEKFAGIGVRIEDDVLITKDGHIVLTASAPKTVADIEAIMKEQANLNIDE